jgi:hypothetical protein
LCCVISVAGFARNPIVKKILLEYERFFKTHFPYLSIAPEEYAARHAHKIATYPFLELEFEDLTAGRWAKRLGEILMDECETERCRVEYLFGEVMARVRREIEEIDPARWL